MKKHLFLCAAIAAILSLVGCEEENPTVSAKVKTLEATEVSMDGYTFNAEAEIKGSSSSNVVLMGVFYNSKPNVSDNSYFLTTEQVEAVNGHNSYSDRDENGTTFLGNRVYYFEKGTTIYYKAYVKVIDATGSRYIFGDEKSFVLK